MKKLPLIALSKEDRKTQLWREQKAAQARKTRKLRRDNLRLSEEMLVSAAKAVVRDWETKKLSCSVRELDMAIEAYEGVRK
ncbi:MAG: hypothetical protein BWY66_00376 [bacterium ADurb.Bin374]|nr:MAG: hypothetical protein BWY66_00376 [bacterium ADurb.Bin374]